ncbi:ABC transporter substrate-binding protein [Streptomyces sp. BH106]|uniref:ABC transporter substrate-binding protein n=1 Tax=Streptomyces sp. BH106 TaxID=3410409 RepID=UPI003CF53BD8
MFTPSRDRHPHRRLHHPPTHRPPSRRALLRGAAGLGVTAALAACGQGATTPRTSGDVTLALWTHDQNYEKFFTRAIPAADRLTDFAYHLSTTRAGAPDLVTKLLAQAVAERGVPDMVGFEMSAFPRMLRGDIAERLLRDFGEDVAKVPGLKEDLLPARTAPFSKDGKLYGLDSDTPLVVHYYRRDLYEKYGIPVAADTWEEFAEIGERAHRKHDVALNAVVTGPDVNQVVQSFQMLFNQRGGGLFDKDQNLTLDSPEAVEALDFVCRGLRAGFITPVSDYFGGPMQAALKQGKVIGVLMATWFKIYGLMPNVPEQKGRWGMTAPPRFAAGGHATSTSGGTGFGVLRNKPNSRAATEFLHSAYLTHEAQVRRFHDLGYLPTRASVYKDKALLRTTDAYLGGQRPFDVYTALLDDAPRVYVSPDQSILNDVLAGCLLSAYRGDLTPRAAIRKAAADFRDQAGR